MKQSPTILNFGGEARNSVVEAFEKTLSGEKLKISILSVMSEKEVSYESFNGTLSEALEKIKNGSAISIEVVGTEVPSLHGGVYCPLFDKDILKDWSAYIEGGYCISEGLFHSLRKVTGLNYIALSLEDSPDFNFKHITNITFPWSDWRLIIGAALNDNNEWVIKRGPVEFPQSCIHNS